MAFNLDNYEDVNARVKRFQEAFPLGRIETEIVEFSMEKQYALIKASCYRDDEATTPAGVDFALEWSSKSPVSRQWFLENASTSAIGRCIALVLPVDHKATKSDMAKVQSVTVKTVTPEEVDLWAIAPKEEGFVTVAEAVAELNTVAEPKTEAPLCVHGHMIFKEAGAQKVAEGGKDWGGYFCTERTKANQCAPQWCVRSATTGEWRLK